MPAEEVVTHFFDGVDVLASDQVVLEGATALLWKDEPTEGLRRWGGRLGVGFDFGFNLFGKDDLVLRFGDGKTGRFQVTESDSDDAYVEIDGSGPAPF
jgi:hypothetical protein